MNQELTEWYPADVKPNFIGVYEVKVFLGSRFPWYAYWAGEGWLPFYGDVDSSYNRRNYDPLAFTQNKVWRGLARPIK